MNHNFDVFWKAYPRKQGKKAADKAWKNAKDKPDLDAILKAIEGQKQSEQWRKEGGQFIPLPATWLNQGRWADEPITPSAPLVEIPNQHIHDLDYRLTLKARAESEEIKREREEKAKLAAQGAAP